jgi:hypothetical protein
MTELNNYMETIYTFNIGRNLYTIRFEDIKKITFLEHNFIEKRDDVEEIIKNVYVFTVYPKQKDAMPIIELQVDENEYSNFYIIYKDLINKYDEFRKKYSKHYLKPNS